MNTLAWWSQLRKVVLEAHRVRDEHYELDEALPSSRRSRRSADSSSSSAKSYLNRQRDEG
jgi:hypothetical protein